MFRVEMLAADHGDCLWIEYGDPQKPHLVLIDGGTPATWKRLEQRILREKQKRGQDMLHFEAFIVTHVDADHIGGAVKLLEQVGPLDLTFGDVWFNGYQHLLEVAGGKMGEPGRHHLRLHAAQRRDVPRWEPADRGGRRILL